MAEKDQAGGRGGGEQPRRVGDASLPALPAEVLDAIRQSNAGQININILLTEVTQKAQSADEMVTTVRQLLALSEDYEEHQLKAFQRRADAIIGIKEKDPDEIEKRRNNQYRRGLKVVIAACALLSMGGGIACGLLDAPITVTGSILTFAVVALALLGPLASGESISPNDVVQIVQAARGARGQAAPANRATQSDSRRRR